MLEMGFGADQSAQQRQDMKVWPRLIQANEVLQLSSQDLEQLISRELQENPALEVVEAQRCDVCGTELHGSICPQCLSRQKGTIEGEEGWEDSGGSVRDLSISTDDDESDVWGRVAAEATLSERLIMQLHATLPDTEHAIAEYLVGALDEDGYLRTSLNDVAEALGVDRERAQAVLTQLQDLDPPGVGARNLRECLLIQLKYVQEVEGRHNELAQMILESGLLDDLGARRFNRIAEILKVHHDDVEEAAAFIGNELTPYPARQQWDLDPGTRPARTGRVLPDVLITRDGDLIRVEVVESHRFRLQVSPSYRQMIGQVERAPSQYSDDERKHVRDYVNRARLFLDNIRQRRETMRKIAQVVVEEQDGFLRHGVRHLKPLTRAKVAQQIGVHESTVSRATNGKYAMLPDARVLPMADFFTPNLAPKDVLREILHEAPRLTDAEIADQLAREHDIHIARRTVAKYRKQLGILPSTLR
jgi:RNA polymerase sigma-54 factor